MVIDARGLVIGATPDRKVGGWRTGAILAGGAAVWVMWTLVSGERERVSGRASERTVRTRDRVWFRPATAR